MLKKYIYLLILFQYYLTPLKLLYYFTQYLEFIDLGIAIRWGEIFFRHISAIRREAFYFKKKIILLKSSFVINIRASWPLFSLFGMDFAGKFARYYYWLKINIS
jgi:hypothetical protein